MPYPPYPTASPTTTIPPQAAERSADSDWRGWGIVHSPRWVRSENGPDYLAWQGTTVAIIHVATGGFTFDLNGRRPDASWPTEVEAKTAAAAQILAGPRRDKERARLLRESQERSSNDSNT